MNKLKIKETNLPEPAEETTVDSIWGTLPKIPELKSNSAIGVSNMQKALWALVANLFEDPKTPNQVKIELFQVIEPYSTEDRTAVSGMENKGDIRELCQIILDYDSEGDPEDQELIEFLLHIRAMNGYYDLAVYSHEQASELKEFKFFKEHYPNLFETMITWAWG